LQNGLKPGAKVLDIGCGSGILYIFMFNNRMLLFYKMIGQGTVYGIDHIEELVSQAKINISKTDPNLIQEGKIQFFVGDGRLGLPKYAPYDVIHVGACIL